MKAMRVFFRDMKQVLSSPMLLVTFIAVAFIPILYSGMLIKGSWDPYGQLSNLPVAVVNLDEGAQYQGTSMNAGADFVSELKKNSDFKWNFVTADQARDGMVDNKYYMTITIPKEFSSKATTLMNDHPEKAEILFEPNGDYNFIAGQIGNSAIKDLKAKISDKITEAYTRSMFDQVKTISSGLGEAGDGATQLKDGAGQLQQGLETFKTNLAKLADGTNQLQNGVQPLLSGTAKLYEGTSSVGIGAANLTSGLKQLAAAEQQLQTGAVQANAGTDQLVKGIQSAADGTSQLKSGLAASSAAGGQLSDGAAKVAEGFSQLLNANPQLAQMPELQQLLAASQSVAQGAKQLHDGQQQLLQGGEKLDQGQQQLLQGAGQLQAGQTKLAAGLQQFGSKLSEAAAGSQKLAGGSTALTQGVSQLQTGLNQFASGITGIADGTAKLNDGSSQLNDGAVKLADGTNQLALKLVDAANQTSQVNAKDDTVSMFAQPVQVTENKDRKVSQYGQGIAPYFLSLALFVGGLVFTTCISARESSVPNASRMERFVSRTFTFLGMSIMQSLIADLIIQHGLKLPIHNVPMFYLFTLFVGLTFTAIIQCLVTWFDHPGRFLIVLLMITQLTSSAGTFPRELIPHWMQKINPWLPMTHSIAGFKTVILSGDINEMWVQAGYLSLYFAAFVLLTLIYFVKPNRTLSRETRKDSDTVMA